jgi:hypothetical protein
MMQIKLQIDLNIIYKWCIKNAMHLNISNYSTITFSLKRIPIHLIIFYTMFNKIYSCQE